MSRRSRGRNSCRERTEYPSWVHGKQGNLRCDLTKSHEKQHEAGFSYEGKHHTKIWPHERDRCPVRVWDNGDRTNCDYDMPCPTHGYSEG